MGILELAGLTVALAALFAFANNRLIGLPPALGVMVIALGTSLVLIAAGHLFAPGLTDWASRSLAQIDFSDTVLEGMLSFLLFAGALFVNLEDLARHKWVIAGLASLGVVTSACLVAVLTWLIFPLFGQGVPFLYCLLFGALVSPTDPLAVLGILKSAGVPADLETKITGESLFNDGVAVVLFLAVLETVRHGGGWDPVGIAELLVLEVVGGLLFGLAIGGVAYSMLHHLEDYAVQVLVTLAVVLGGYALAGALHLSGPLAMVAAGLLLGNRGRTLAMSETAREQVDHFWEMVDEVLNVVLFVLIGLEVLVLPFAGPAVLGGLVMIPAVLAARFVSVSIPVTLLRARREFPPGVIRILTWGGLRGGISVALALSLPAGELRDLLLPATYIIVVFSLLAQGLTVGPLARRWSRAGTPA